MLGLCVSLHLCETKGIEGTYITYPPDYSTEDEDPLQGIHFVISPSLGEDNINLIPLPSIYHCPRSLATRSSRTYPTTCHILYRRHIFYRSEKPSGFWACQSCTLRRYARNAEGNVYPYWPPYVNAYYTSLYIRTTKHSLRNLNTLLTPLHNSPSKSYGSTFTPHFTLYPFFIF